MTAIVWLDDQPSHIRDVVTRIEAVGFEVTIVATEREALQRLSQLPAPSLLIQDLYRPAIPWRNTFPSGHSDSHELLEAGWAFYRHILCKEYPQLPVIIYSLDGADAGHRKTADDFNLTLITKGQQLHVLLSAINTAIAQSTTILPPRTAPAASILDLSTVNARLLRYLAEHPSAVHELHHSTFEELVARLLIELGYEVERTKLTRDGGVDIWALKRGDLTDTLYAIDAKKYREGKIVGPEPVRAIYGVASLANATAGLIVTTAGFGPAAKALAAQYRHRLGLRDFEGLKEWFKRVAAEQPVTSRTL